MAIDWSHGGTGTSETAITDNGAISNVNAGGAVLRVMDRATNVPSAPSAWPTNLLRCETVGAGSALVGWDAGSPWSAPAVDSTIYFRLLHYNALATSPSIAFEHGAQSNIGTIRHTWQFFSPSSGSACELGFGSLSGPGTRSNYLANVIPARPYRFEWAMTRRSSTWDIEIRVFDESVSLTVPEYTAADFLENWGGGPTSIADLSGYTIGDVAETFQRYLFGVSGSGSNSTAGLYLGGFAVSLTDWCGAYVSGEAD